MLAGVVGGLGGLGGREQLGGGVRVVERERAGGEALEQAGDVGSGHVRHGPRGQADHSPSGDRFPERSVDALRHPGPVAAAVLLVVTRSRNGRTAASREAGSSSIGQWPLSSSTTTSARGNVSRCRSA